MCVVDPDKATIPNAAGDAGPAPAIETNIEASLKESRRVGIFVGAFALAATVAGTVVAGMFSPNLPPTLIVTNAAVVILAPLLLFATFALRDRTDKSPLHAIFVNIMALVLGGLAGGALAAFWVPFGETDKGVYGQIGAAVAAFVSGYALSKVGPIFVQKLDTRDGVFLTQLALGAACFILCAVAIVTHRVEWLATSMQKAPAAEDSALREREKADVAALRAAYAASAAVLAVARAASAPP